jgi:hypothetical protein
MTTKISTDNIQAVTIETLLGTYTKSYRYSGLLAANQGDLRYYFHQPTVCEQIDVFVDEEPVGADVVISILKNSVQSQTITLPAGDTSVLGTSSTLSFTSGDFITVDITQVGTTSPGTNLYIVFTFK